MKAFAAAPRQIHKRVDLATLPFVQETANVILLGPPEVGKTHLAVALGIEAIRHGIGVFCNRSHSR